MAREEVSVQQHGIPRKTPSDQVSAKGKVVVVVEVPLPLSTQHGPLVEGIVVVAVEHDLMPAAQEDQHQTLSTL